MTKDPFFSTPEQVAQMALQIKSSKEPQAPRDLAIIHMLYCCGLTLAELALLKVGDVFIDPENSPMVRPTADTKQNSADENVTKTIYLFDSELIDSLKNYRQWRLTRYAESNDLVSGKSPEAKLFVNDKGEEFTRVRTNSTSTKDYHSYQSLSHLIRSIHSRYGADGGNAESARRSWTLWLYHGLDGKTPVPPELLMELRGDARLSGTLMACGVEPACKAAASQTHLWAFMSHRSLASPIEVSLRGWNDLGENSPLQPKNKP